MIKKIIPKPVKTPHEPSFEEICKKKKNQNNRNVKIRMISLCKCVKKNNIINI